MADAKHAADRREHSTMQSTEPSARREPPSKHIALNFAAPEMSREIVVRAVEERKSPLAAGKSSTTHKPRGAILPMSLAFSES